MFDIERAFSFHQLSDEGERISDELKDKFKELAYEVVRAVPNNRERSLALTNLEQSWQWADSGFRSFSDTVVLP
ncbi:DUF7681 family protein [Mycobacteroides chelonae]|uniref:Acb2/Tad1 domain-containing protein n=1 Tax=Mycobacteroides chelonae TaxID=1774 RepID=UPI000992058E|nr:hypothetical protein [Mycobacteroides chelonae]